jgi:hypothetical protein
MIYSFKIKDFKLCPYPTTTQLIDKTLVSVPSLEKSGFYLLNNVLLYNIRVLTAGSLLLLPVFKMAVLVKFVAFQFQTWFNQQS